MARAYQKAPIFYLFPVWELYLYEQVNIGRLDVHYSPF